MKTISCKDNGINCPFVAKGTTADEAAKNLMHHAEKSHRNELKKMQDTMSEAQIMEKMRSVVKDE